MANAPVPERAARGLIVPPNQTIGAGGGASNSYLSLAPHAGAVGPPSFGPTVDHLGGTADYRGPSPPITLPSQRFDAATSAMPQPPCAVEPGEGAVPVELCEVKDRPERFGALLNVSWPSSRPGPD